MAVKGMTQVGHKSQSRRFYPMKKVLVCSLLVLAMSASAFGAAFKIGGTGPLTGGAAIYGIAAMRGAQIAAEEINALGGDVQFDLRYEDDTHDAEKAVNAYNALKDWGMQVSLGSVTSKPVRLQQPRISQTEFSHSLLQLRLQP